MNEANNLKVQSQKNNMMIRRQKEAEMMKNASIKEMIRKQKLDATDRREFVSGIGVLWHWPRIFLLVGNTWQEAAAAQ